MQTEIHRDYAAMTEQQRYSFMDIEKPKMTFQEFYAKMKILLHRLNGEDLTEEVKVEKLWEMKREFEKLLRWAKNNNEAFAHLIMTPTEDAIIMETKRQLSVDMETY